MMWIRLWWKKVGWMGGWGRTEEELDFFFFAVSTLLSILIQRDWVGSRIPNSEANPCPIRRITKHMGQTKWTLWLKLIIQYCVLINWRTVTLKDFYILWTFYTTWRVVIHTTFSFFYIILALDVQSSGPILKSRPSKSIIQYVNCISGSGTDM